MVGIIPQCVCDMQYLQYVYIDNNKLVGEIPSCVSEIPPLVDFMGACNYFTGKAMGGRGQMLEKYFVECTQVECPE